MDRKHFLIIIFFIAYLSALSGCSSDSDNGTAYNGTMVKLSGALTPGTVASKGSLQWWAAKLPDFFKSAFAVDPQEFTVVVVDNENNKTYSTRATTSGDFSIDVPADGRYVVSIINDGSYVGPIVFDNSNTAAYTAIKPTDDTQLGAITVDTTQGFAATTNIPNAMDTSIAVTASGGVPVGAGNDGKTKNVGVTNGTDADIDKDGIPNLFDADEDSDGFRNGLKDLASTRDVTSEVVESVFMSSNIWADHGTTDSAENLIALRLHVVPKVTQKNKIASVACIDVPSSIAALATVRWADSLGAPASYPAEWSSWQAAGYGLYKTTTLSTEQWIVSIKPGAIMEVGDTFTIRVTYADSTYEDFFISMAYVLTDWAKVTTYNGTTMPSIGTKQSPVSFNADSLIIKFFKPKDEDGNYLEGLTYSLTYGVSDCTGGTCSVPASTSVIPSSQITDNGDGTLTAAAVTTTTSATYYITPVAESADGQRNGEETWFTRQ